ncbi:nuclear transport factor 2 family protein [Rhizobium rhizogenes]|jgi:uncharacterized protein (TIGR02246 family)|uniref:YybH family protein n=1 Tax=Rhizobium rhizogenes TaxID=359 RepID=UPI0022C4EA37|nr:nuclear transport factor 2 family protein [Rhizobium rhizogenes]MCZ7467143.1 nuclear transport factor 2 family protein [Rhizobium rhizogenes]
MLDTHPLVALELAALERWCNGDPSGFLELYADDIVYFDPYLPQRLDGLEKLTEYYEAIRGKISAPRYEMIEPHVTEIGDAAVLTFRFNSYSGSEGKEMRWNCTEVYRRQDEGWRIVQSHWSFTGPLK